MRIRFLLCLVMLLLVTRSGWAQSLAGTYRWSGTGDFPDTAIEGIAVGGSNYLIGKGGAGGYLVKSTLVGDPVSQVLIGASDTRLNSVTTDSVSLFVGGDSSPGGSACQLQGATAVQTAFVARYDSAPSQLACNSILFQSTSGAETSEVGGIAYDRVNRKVFVGGQTLASSFAPSHEVASGFPKLSGNSTPITLTYYDLKGDDPGGILDNGIEAVAPQNHKFHWRGDAYIAVLEPDLASGTVITFGTDQWEEIMDLRYDPVNRLVYVAGSTKGDMCSAYHFVHTSGCSASYQNGKDPITGQELDTDAAGNQFDSFLAVFAYSPSPMPSVSPLTLVSVYQEGVKGEDNYSHLALGSYNGVNYAYAAGHQNTQPNGDNHFASRVTRFVINSPASPGRDLLDTHTQYVRDDGTIPDNKSASPTGILIDGTNVFVAGDKDSPSGTHAGLCGNMEASQTKGIVERIDLLQPLDYYGPLANGPPPFATLTSLGVAGTPGTPPTLAAPGSLGNQDGHGASVPGKMFTVNNVLHVMGTTTTNVNDNQVVLPTDAYCGSSFGPSGALEAVTVTDAVVWKGVFP